MSKDVSDMTREDFEAVPLRKTWSEETPCSSFVILPARDGEDLHDSGYRRMDFVLCVDRKPVCRVGGCADVLHFDGIGGCGYRWHEQGGVPTMVPENAWQVDCLPTSGLLRVFSRGQRTIVFGAALSSAEVYVVPEEAE